MPRLQSERRRAQVPPDAMLVSLEGSVRLNRNVTARPKLTGVMAYLQREAAAGNKAGIQKSDRTLKPRTNALCGPQT